MATFILTDGPDVFPGLGQDNSGNDTIVGGGGDDFIDGGTGTDVFVSGPGNDTFIGGGGTDLDTADYSADPGPIRVNQRENAYQAGIPPDTVYDGFGGIDSIPAVRNIIGSAFADDIRGGGHANRLDGGAGDDYIFGFDGRDTIIGGAGNDTLDGGNGIDTAVFAGARSSYAVSVAQDGTVTVTNTAAPAGTDTDTLANFEFVEFGDGTVSMAQLTGDPLRAPVGTKAAGPGAEALAGDAAGTVKESFFFDTGLMLGLGKDSIASFGKTDYVLTTSRIFDGNKDGIVEFGKNGLLDLPGATGVSPANPFEASATGQVSMKNAAGQAITKLHYDGTVSHDGVDYYVYSQIGSGVTLSDVVFA